MKHSLNMPGRYYTKNGTIKLMQIDKELINWFEKELDKTPYGRVGLVFVLHEGKIVKIEKIHHKKLEYPFDKKIETS